MPESKKIVSAVAKVMKSEGLKMEGSKMEELKSE